MPSWWLQSRCVITNSHLLKHVGSSNTRSFFIALAEGMRFLQSEENRQDKLDIRLVNSILIKLFNDPWAGVLANAPMMDDSEEKLRLMRIIEDTFKVTFQLYSSNSRGAFVKSSMYNTWVNRNFNSAAEESEASKWKEISLLFNPSSSHWCCIVNDAKLLNIYQCEQCSTVFEHACGLYQHRHTLCGRIDEEDPEKHTELTGREKAGKHIKRDEHGMVRIRNYRLSALRPTITLEEELNDLNLGASIPAGALAYNALITADTEAFLKFVYFLGKN